MIRKRGTGWVVTNTAGTKVLGHHSDRGSAVKQLQAIEISKHAGEPGATQPRKTKSRKRKKAAHTSYSSQGMGY